MEKVIYLQTIKKHVLLTFKVFLKEDFSYATQSVIVNTTNFSQENVVQTEEPITYILEI